MYKQAYAIAIMISSLLICTAPVCAGSAAGGEPQFEAGQIISFAKKVEKAVADRGARVFILARLGRLASDLPDGFHYTHVAFGVYSMIKTADGRQVPGYAIYNLYQDEKVRDRSKLITDYPVDFFAGVYELKTSILIPKPALQKQLLEVIASDTYRKLHNPDYSVVANPYNRQYQNCTEHTLDVINAAIYRTDDIRRIKANERAYFEAQRVRINPLKMLVGALAMPDVKTSDQKGGIKTASFSTIARYLKQYDLVQEELVIAQ